MDTRDCYCLSCELARGREAVAQKQEDAIADFASLQQKVRSLEAEIQTSRTAVRFADDRVRVMEKQWHDAEALYYAEQKKSKKLENLCKLATEHRDALLFTIQEANRYSNTLENLLGQFANLLEGSDSSLAP